LSKTKPEITGVFSISTANMELKKLGGQTGSHRLGGVFAINPPEKNTAWTKTDFSEARKTQFGK